MDAFRKEVVAFLNATVEKAHRTARISACLDEAMSYMKRQSVSYPMHLLPWQCCTHPSNRDRYMLNTDHCHGLIDDISAVGAIPKMVDAVATEACEDDISSNVKLIEQSNGRLAAIDPGSIKASCLAASHFTAGANCFHREVAHPGNENLTVGGKLNVAKLRAWDPTYADLVEHGYEFTMVPRWVLNEVPEFVWLIQAGKNVNVAKKEHQVQIADRIFAESRRCMDPQGKVDYNKVKDKILMTKPTNPECKFVNANCAGADPFMLRQCRDFVRANCSLKHTIGEKEWQVLSEEKTHMKRAPRFRWALVQYMYFYGDTTLGDVKKVQSSQLQDNIEKADQTMNQFRGIFFTSSPSSAVVRTIGMAECQIAAATLTLKSAMHKSMWVVAHHYFEELKQKLQVEAESPYKILAYKDDVEFFNPKADTSAQAASKNSTSVMKSPCAHALTLM